MQMGVEQMSMKEAMKQMKEQTAQMVLKAHQEAQAAAAEREVADTELTKTRGALEAEQNKVKSVEVGLIHTQIQEHSHAALSYVAQGLLWFFSVLTS